MAEAVGALPGHILRVDEVDGRLGRGKLNEACCGVDIQAGAYDDEYVGRSDLLCRALDLGHRLSKPHYERPQLTAVGRTVADVDIGVVGWQLNDLRGIVWRERRCGFHQFSVQVYHMRGAGALMKVVDVLRDHRHLERPFELSHQVMPATRFHGWQLPPPFVVEVEHEARVALIALDGRNVLYTMLFPQPARVAEGADAALGRHASTCKNNDLFHTYKHFSATKLAKITDKKQ